MDGDWQHDDLECPKCGEWAVRSQTCWVIGCDDGLIDGYEEDPLWYDEGDCYPCPECGGRGFHRWCAKCGADLKWHQWPVEAQAGE